MDAVATFLDMGGYGRFVWPAFAATVIVLLGLLIASRRSLKANQATLAHLQKESAGDPPSPTRDR